MSTLRKTLRTGHVWLTAFMMLIATTPRLECRCPDGQVKPFCIQSALGTESSCCDQACCAGETSNPSANTDVDDEACSCCQARKAAGPADCQVEDKGCDRSLVAPAEVVASKVSPVEIKLDATSFLPLPAARDGWRQQGQLHLRWEPQLLPPPTDRVVLLERFLI
jgi:hypothetical protein